MRHLLLLCFTLCSLLLPAYALAADPMQDALKEKAQADQEQRAKLLQAASELEQHSGKTLSKGEKAFPGTVPPTGALQQGAPQGRAPAQKPGAGPKSTTPIYGDIIIHK